MKCINFESIFMDLARDQVADAEVRDQALAHARACDSCRTRLLDERSLTEGLRTLRAAAADAKAPQRVERALRAAFRQARPAAAAGVPRVQTVSRRRISLWLPALAASLLLAVSLAATQPWRSSPKGVGGPYHVLPAPPPDLTGAPASHGPAESPEVEPKLSETKVAVTGRRSPTRIRAPLRPTTLEVSPGPTGSEISTDFYPVTLGGFPPMEGGQVARVRVPRSTLASFGLPMNADRAAEPIPAEILFGHDGLARAIRFVGDGGSVVRVSGSTDNLRRVPR